LWCGNPDVIEERAVSVDEEEYEASY
jgi:hypothetical protein